MEEEEEDDIDVGSSDSESEDGQYSQREVKSAKATKKN